MHLPTSLACVCLISSFGLTIPAMAAPPDPADLLFNDGVAEMEAKRFEEGCPKLEESYRLNPRPGTLFALAYCEAERGRIATAVARYDEYLVLYDTLPPDKKAKQGTRQKESLEQKAVLGPHVPELTLVLPPNAPRGMVVKRDGAELSAAKLGVALSVDPGVHVITIQVPGGPVTEVHLTIGKGEKQQIPLQVKAAPEAPPPIPPIRTTKPSPAGQAPGPQDASPPAGTGPSGRRVGAYIAGGIGAAGVVLGSVTGGMMLAQKGIVDDNCKDGSTGIKLCRNTTGIDAGNSARTLGNVSTIGFIMGLTGLGLATVLFVTEPRSPKKAALQREGGRWVRAGLLEAGKSGMLLGGRGAW